MLCCAIDNYKDLKQYLKMLLLINEPPVKLDTSEIGNEWESISTP